MARAGARPCHDSGPGGGAAGTRRAAADGEAFVQPLHDVMRFNRQTRLDDPNRRYTYIECLSNLRNTNGRPTQLTASDPRYIDYYGRPWAQNWEKYFETGWDKPSEDLPADVLDIIDRLDGQKK